VVVNDLDSDPQLLHNQTPTDGNWLLVKLEGSGKLTDAIGAIVTVEVGEQIMTRMIRSGSAYLSQEDMRLHFGLAAAEKVDTLRVLWPDGQTTEKNNVDVNQLLVIEQD